jgi:ATP-dependent RNA helicase DDX10/DBP4
MLFSATIRNKLKDLVRLKLKKDHEYISLHDYDSVEGLANEIGTDDKVLTDQLKNITPLKLLHHYMVTNIDEKLDTLFSFVKSHQKSKVLVFFSSCK